MNVQFRQPFAIKGKDGFPRRTFSVAEILKMIEHEIIAEDEKFELIDGEIIPMSPKHSAHEWVKSRLVGKLAKALPFDLLIGVEASVFLDETTFVDPDIILYPRTIATEDLTGPDIPLVIEIADTSLRYDLERKAPLYAKAGFPEYWLINAKTRASMVFRGPSEAGWSETFEVPADQPISFAALPQFSITFSLET
jgi:Uma2 family endonuclease